MGGEHRVVRFDVENNHIKIPDAECLPETGNLSFDFNFGHTFAKTNPPTSLTDGEISFAQAAFAALQGHLRAVMSNMYLSPTGLLNLCGYQHGYAERFIDVGTHSTTALFRPHSPTPSSSSSSSPGSPVASYYSQSDQERSSTSSAPQDFVATQNARSLERDQDDLRVRLLERFNARHAESSSGYSLRNVVSGDYGGGGDGYRDQWFPLPERRRSI